MHSNGCSSQQEQPLGTQWPKKTLEGLDLEVMAIGNTIPKKDFGGLIEWGPSSTMNEM
jgi:hypothetical protein